jgi:hypothetical protein
MIASIFVMQSEFAPRAPGRIATATPVQGWRRHRFARIACSRLPGRRSVPNGTSRAASMLDREALETPQLADLAAEQYDGLESR